ncbi:hypothetical protein LWC34_49300 [Kibdelosporangium philippinense]|uniref:Uncharacterized protein n=2 Tax=Kibdelosporangium philippinense TaxID=211113 RepID=A0ABS8ZT30_9PSEU|nr:hypothetical protein [Kibdelosporangium philippinense]MCE7010749.1 hypothetical protein [Kibdelosporangium philippinense]
MAVRPFVVAVPGATAARLAAERSFRDRGWRQAANPVEANLLVVAGDIDVDLVWGQMPLPKAKVELASAADVDRAIGAAVRGLRDRRRQYAEPESTHGTASDLHRGHDDSEAVSDAHAAHGHDMGQASMAGHQHGGHDHGMGEMVMPGGIPMASRTADRDGLALDYLHIFLGPVLADWPPGLVVKAIMQGDVLQEVEVDVVGIPGNYWTEDRMPARRLDSCARLLGVAGWETAATRARELRDRVLSGQDADVDRWAKRVRRSRVLKWSLVGVGEWQGRDAWDRLNAWLDQTDVESDIATLPDLLNGSELGNARLIVASLDPDTDHG